MYTPYRRIGSGLIHVYAGLALLAGFIELVCVSSGVFCDEIFNCDGVIQNHPCGEKRHLSTLVVPDEAGPTSNDAVENTPQPSATPVPQVKPLITPRPDPKMTWRVETSDKFSTRFSGTLTGSGEVEIKVSIFQRSTAGLEKIKELQSFTYHLPLEGGTKPFDFKINTPAYFYRYWFLDAKNKGRWAGYHDLSGCCPSKTAHPKCQPDGAVNCGGVSVSATCRCQ
jgi:hypothetical protein